MDLHRPKPKPHPPTSPTIPPSTMPAPLIIDGGEQFILGANGEYDFINGGSNAGPWWSQHYRRHGLMDGTGGDHYPTINGPVWTDLNAAPWRTTALQASWPVRISLGYEVLITGWINNFNEQKALDVTGWAMTHAQGPLTDLTNKRVIAYTESSVNFLAGAGSIYSAPSTFLRDGMAAIPRGGGKIIYDDSACDADSCAIPSRLASINTILSTYPFDGVVINGAEPFADGPGRGQFVFTSANVTLTMWRNYLAPLLTANLHNCTHNYIRLASYMLDVINTQGELGLQTGSTPIHVFDDWDQIIENFGNLGRAISEAPDIVKGVLIDNEVAAPGKWTDVSSYSPDHTADETYAQGRLRGNQCMEALRTWVPGIEVVELVSPCETVFTDNVTGGFYNEVNGAFFAGLLEQTVSVGQVTSTAADQQLYTSSSGDS